MQREKARSFLCTTATDGNETAHRAVGGTIGWEEKQFKATT